MIKQCWDGYKAVLEIYLASKHVKQFGMSKLGLAKCLGVSQGKMQKWEQGQWPSAADLARMAEKLGLSYRWLVTGKGDVRQDVSEHSAQYPTDPQAQRVRELNNLLDRLKELHADGEIVTLAMRQLLDTHTSTPPSETA